MLQRMRELAVQVRQRHQQQSRPRSPASWKSKQLRDEVDRVAKTTSFNGPSLLDGSFTGAVFQVGANSGDNITVGALANTKVAGWRSIREGTDVCRFDPWITKRHTAAVMSKADTTITITGADGDVGNGQDRQF